MINRGNNSGYRTCIPTSNATKPTTCLNTWFI